MALDNRSSLRAKIDSFLAPDRNADEKAKPGGLLARISQELVGAGNTNAAAIALPILRDLVAQGKLKLPTDALKAEDFKPEFAAEAKSVVGAILTAAGQPGLAVASSAAIDILKKSVDSCGVDRNPTRVAGLPVKQKSGRDVILYFVEENNDEEPLLPLVDGSRMAALARLESGFLNWAGKMKLNVSRVPKHEEANLIVTGDHFGTSTTTLAKTEIGPPRGQQLRMIFNLSKEFTGDDFEANAAHEFGHALGIFHEDVDMNDQALVMHGTNVGVKDPQVADLRAAVDKGWQV